VFGVSFSEVVLIAVVALVVVGPRRLPEILGKLGQWIGRFRQMTTEMRRQTGIDEILRAEGLSGGLAELRSMMRGDLVGAHRFDHVAVPSPAAAAAVDAYGEAVDFDRFREYPVEGPDSYGAVPEDLVAATLPVAPAVPASGAVAEALPVPEPAAPVEPASKEPA